MLTTTAMGFFEGEISRAVVLALFLPLIISSGGNSGSQATTLIIRAMALGEVTLGLWWRVMRREIMVGLLLGLLLGSIGFLRIMLWHYTFHSYGHHWALIGLTIFFSLIGVVLWGSLSGSMLPFILRRCRLDPASCSAPFVATLVDVTGLVIYFSIATLVLRDSLLAPSTSTLVRLGAQHTTQSVHQLMNLDDNWFVKDVEWNKQEHRLLLDIEATDTLEKHVACPRCGGHAVTSAHRAKEEWPYQKVFGEDTVIVSRLPNLRCQKCGETVPVNAPWLTAMHQ
jgi:cation transporter-like permease